MRLEDTRSPNLVHIMTQSHTRVGMILSPKSQKSKVKVTWLDSESVLCCVSACPVITLSLSQFLYGG